MDLFSFIVICTILYMGFFYLTLASVLAAEFDYRNIESHYYGYIISMYSLSSTLSTFVVSWFIDKNGRSCVLYSGLIIQSITIICTGLITYIEDNQIMIVVAMLLRFVQGFFKNFANVMFFSILVILHPDEKIKYIGIYEGASNIGCGLGPVVGSILYFFFGYFYMFMIMGLGFFMFTLMIKLTMPPNINDTDCETKLNDSNSSSNAHAEIQISYCGLFSDHIIKLLAVACLFSYWTYTYYEPILSFRLLDFTDSLPIQSIAYFSLIGGYGLMGFFIMHFAKCIQPVNLVTLGLFFSGVFNFMIGPSKFLPDSLILMIVGLFFTGMSLAFCSIPQIPLMLERAKLRYPSQTLRASDYCSNIYNGVYSLGMFLGPIYGGFMAELVGYRTCCDIMSIIMIIYSIIFFILISFSSMASVSSKTQRQIDDSSTSNNAYSYETNQSMLKSK